MEFYLLNDSLAVVGTLDRITHASVTRRFFAPGEITVSTADVTAPTSSARYIFEAESGVCAVIEKVSYPKEGGSVISGRTAECLLERQVLKREGYFNGSVENAVKTVLMAFAVASGAFPSLVIGSTSGLPESAQTLFEWKNLSEWLYSTLGRYGASFRLDAFDGDDFFTFNVVFGRDLTSRGESGKVVLIREEDSSVADTGFAVDEKGYSNVICVVGNDGRYVTVPDDTPAGLERREGVLMAKDIHPASFETDEGYLAALRKRGESRLASFSERIIFMGSTTGDGMFRLGRDYDLGDICEVETKNGQILALRVTSVTYTYEKGVKMTDVRFGGDISSTAVLTEE